MRKRLYRLLEPTEAGDRIAVWYHMTVVTAILFNLFSLIYHPMHPLFAALQYGSAFIFLTDYFLHFLTADLHLRRGCWSFLWYPFILEPVVDILSILPLFFPVSPVFKLFKTLKLVRSFWALQVLRG